MVIFVIGKSNSGKTTFGKKLIDVFDGVLLDGDDFRSKFPIGYSDEERFENIMRIAKVASIIEEQGKLVVIAMMAPKAIWRQKARELFKESVLFLMPGGELWEGTDYELPKNEQKKNITTNNGLLIYNIAKNIYKNTVT